MYEFEYCAPILQTSTLVLTLLNLWTVYLLQNLYTILILR